MTKKRRLLARILFFLYIAAVLFLCFGNFEGSPDVPRSLLGIPTDKIVHFLMFLPFPVLAFFAFDKYTGKVWEAFLMTGLTLLVGCLLAAGTEWMQSRLSYRTGDPNDFLADFFGLILGSIIILIIDIRKQKKA